MRLGVHQERRADFVDRHRSWFRPLARSIDPRITADGDRGQKSTVGGQGLGTATLAGHNKSAVDFAESPVAAANVAAHRNRISRTRPARKLPRFGSQWNQFQLFLKRAADHQRVT